ncbi:hypothetical protein [Ilumatobacter nonamiensis]|uniref:hypothetical protein n=1 Tax=Ilumatobacter nonamiensis TaxID=467093 RepID=UPI00034C66FA|nr:hypothetical protein [Ilumatobacter nonamiensis]
MKNQTTRIRTGLLTAALAGGTLLGASQLGGIANAQTDETPTEDTTEDTAEDTTDSTESPADDTTTDSAEREGRGQELADLLGVEADALREQLRDGATLAEIAEANGVDVQSVIDLIVAQMSERLDQAVENGRVDEAEAAEKLAEFEERATTTVNEGGRVLEGRRGGRGPGGGHGPGQCDDAAAADDAAGDDATPGEETEELVLVES